MGAPVDLSVTVFALPQAEPLATLAAAKGWQVLADPGGAGVMARFAASGARIALVGAGDVAALAQAAKSRGAALLAVAGEADRLDLLHDAGATHIVRRDADADAQRQALRSAMRHAERTVRQQPDDRREAAQRWIAARLDAGAAVGVAITTLSRIDLVNAAHGRAVGDAVIAAAGERIAELAMSRFGAALVARSGRTAFVLAADADRIAGAADALGEALGRPFVVDGTPIALGCRLGVAISEAGDDAAALLRRANSAVVQGRRVDGAVVHHAEPEGPASIDSLAIDLHHAIERDEIAILYQPQVEIANGRIAGVEALARWDHPRHGSLGAEALFAAAERADLGIAISDHIQRLVLAEAAGWPRALHGLRVSLNLTAADVARPDFARGFLALVDASGFPRGRLTIEITESGMIQDLEAVATLLAHLRGAGCRVAIDDFGTGYSSLAYLKALPLDYLKIDKAMTRDIAGSTRDRVIVRGVIAMARSLGFAVIAEGVETERQRALLAAEGCDFYQGFLRAEPLDVAALTALMEGS